MYTKSIILTSALALAANAIPFHDHSALHRRHQHAHAEVAKRDQTFQIHVHNNCPDDKTFGLFQISPSFEMIAMGDKNYTIPSGHQGSIPADYNAIGMRLSGNADPSLNFDQWSPQALFEFGYSGWSGVEGTAYDISMMDGTDPSIGLQVLPANSACPSKYCCPGDCAPDQGWTSPSQVNAGSPGDTVCYHGLTNFRVIWCPNGQ